MIRFGSIADAGSSLALAVSRTVTLVSPRIDVQRDCPASRNVVVVSRQGQNILLRQVAEVDFSARPKRGDASSHPSALPTSCRSWLLSSRRLR
jgi:hypothetical protein